MNPICKNCQYFREPSAMMPEFSDNPGIAEVIGMWCSNSQSPEFRTFKDDFDTCEKFTERGKKAPIWTQVVKMFGKREEQR